MIFKDRSNILQDFWTSSKILKISFKIFEDLPKILKDPWRSSNILAISLRILARSLMVFKDRWSILQDFSRSSKILKISFKIFNDPQKTLKDPQRTFKDHLWRQNCLLGITYPRNICKQCLFMSCAGVIKQALNHSFWTLQYTCFVISSIMSKLCLLLRPNIAWTNGTNLSLIDEVAMIKWVTWESYISQTSLVTYVFYCTFQVTIMWKKLGKRLKKI